jgi:hypothetical protein
MRAISIITSVFLAVSAASAASIIPKELADLATRGDPDRLAILGALQTFITDFSYPRYVLLCSSKYTDPTYCQSG